MNQSYAIIVAAVIIAFGLYLGLNGVGIGGSPPVVFAPPPGCSVEEERALNALSGNVARARLEFRELDEAFGREDFFDIVEHSEELEEIGDAMLEHAVILPYSALITGLIGGFLHPAHEMGASAGVRNHDQAHHDSDNMKYGLDAVAYGLSSLCN